MNRHNAKLNAYAVRQLDLTPSDRILEIGFGGGVNLPSLIAGAAFVGGVDRSREMVRRAKARFSEAVSAGRAIFREGNVEELPFDVSSFGKVCTVNTVYFWRSLDAGFAEIHRVLSPGGRVVVGFLPKERMDRMGMPKDIFTSRAPEDVIAALTKAGFSDVRIERPEPTAPWKGVLGVLLATRKLNREVHSIYGRLVGSSRARSYQQSTTSDLWHKCPLTGLGTGRHESFAGLSESGACAYGNSGWSSLAP